MFSLFRKKKDICGVSAVVAAAGSSTRMQGVDKLRAIVGDMPVLAHTLQAISACRRVDEIIIVCREQDIADYYALVQEFGFDQVRTVIGGGSSRQESVFRGVCECSEDAKLIIIHDGARPLVTPELIEQCIEDALLHGAAAAGIPMRDTVKICSPDGFVTSTPPRESLFAVQTPQIFHASLYREAMHRAQATGLQYTDDCQLIEQIGKKVYISKGSFENIKITTPEDLLMAEAILSVREGRDMPWM